MVTSGDSAADASFLLPGDHEDIRCFNQPTMVTHLWWGTLE